MTSFVGSALFYPVSYASAQLLDLVRGVTDPRSSIPWSSPTRAAG